MLHRVFTTVTVLIIGAHVVSAENWPQWRGPSLNGVSSEKGLPLRWSATENITWKLAMPERSGSTPIVWGEHVFLSVGEGADLALWSVDRDRGTVQQPGVSRHRHGRRAAARLFAQQHHRG